MVGRVHAPCRVGQNQLFDADGGQNPDRQRDFPLGQPLIKVDAALEHHHVLALLPAKHQCTHMARRRGNGEIGDLGKRNPHRIRQRVGKVTQAAAQHQADGGPLAGVFQQISRGGIDLVFDFHKRISFFDSSFNCFLWLQYSSSWPDVQQALAVRQNIRDCFWTGIMI